MLLPLSHHLHNAVRLIGASNPLTRLEAGGGEGKGCPPAELCMLDSGYTQLLGFCYCSDEDGAALQSTVGAPVKPTVRLLKHGHATLRAGLGNAH